MKNPLANQIVFGEKTRNICINTLFSISHRKNFLSFRMQTSRISGRRDMKVTTDRQIDPDDVRSALSRLVQDSAFSKSPQLVKFIRYVVEATLNGKAERLKAYAIGVDVLGRNEDFDPQIDPIVRVEARRLRQAIESFYAGPGTDESIRIEIPRGSYAPVFHRRVSNRNKAHEGGRTKPLTHWPRFSMRAPDLWPCLQRSASPSWLLIFYWTSATTQHFVAFGQRPH